jgi:hypothetical protein
LGSRNHHRCFTDALSKLTRSFTEGSRTIRAADWHGAPAREPQKVSEG